jgi:hypothetical protein
MENKIIVLGSILAASAVTIALCVIGKKKEEEKSNATGYSRLGSIRGGGGTAKIRGTTMSGTDLCACRPTNSICPDGCDYTKGK